MPSSEVERMRKRKFYFVFLVLLAALIFLAAGFFWWRWSMLPVSIQTLAPGKIFVVKKGESLSSIAARLEEEGLIRNSFAFKILVLTKELSDKIQAGDFRIQPSLTPEEIASLLSHGSIDIWLTFPEGWRREEFARRLETNLEDFNTQEFIEITENLEGYLFPDTYLIPKEAIPSAVLKIFENNFKKKFTPDLEQEAEEKGLTQGQVLILASIVEREARSDKDRPMVAGILLKRWRENWPLQVDATVQYALADEKCGWEMRSGSGGEDGKCEWWPKGLTKTDLEIDSPYNTYKYKGLPPTPICNSGLASIKAVIDPQETEHWFYLSDLQGRMHYAKTIEEHQANVARFLRK